MAHPKRQHNTRDEMIGCRKRKVDGARSHNGKIRWSWSRRIMFVNNGMEWAVAVMWQWHIHRSISISLHQHSKREKGGGEASRQPFLSHTIHTMPMDDVWRGHLFSNPVRSILFYFLLHSITYGWHADTTTQRYVYIASRFDLIVCKSTVHPPTSKNCCDPLV